MLCRERVVDDDAVEEPLPVLGGPKPAFGEAKPVLGGPKPAFGEAKPVLGGPKPPVVAAPGDSYRFKTSLEWDPKMDPKGLIRRFPLVWDADGRCLPLLLAAFDKGYLVKVILPRAVAAVGPEAAALLMLGVDTSDTDDERLRENALHLYTRPEGFAEVNRLMRLHTARNKPGAPLWAFVAILQMALVKARKRLTGGTFYRGGLISKARLKEILASLAAGDEGKIILRGVTSCSVFEKAAADFARGAEPTDTMVRVMYCLSLDAVSYTVAMQQAQLPYGPAVAVDQISKFPKEGEVIMLDGTELSVSSGDLKERSRTPFTAEVARYDFTCVQIKAKIVWDGLLPYFALCDQAKSCAT
jgi:hypothetical protein